MYLNLNSKHSCIGQQRGSKPLVCKDAQLRAYCSYRLRQASVCNSVSGSKVQPWQPLQIEQQLAPPYAVAAPESPAIELEPEQQQQQQQQQQQEGAALHVPGSASVRHNSQERVGIAKDLGLHRAAAPGGGSSSSSIDWLELADAAAVLTAAPPATAAQTEAAADAASAPEAELARRFQPLPKGWAAAAAADAAAAAAAVDADAVQQALQEQHDEQRALLQQLLQAKDQELAEQRALIRQLEAEVRAQDAIIAAERRRAAGSFGTAVDGEAAAMATIAAADAAVVLAAAANVASAESGWLYDSELVQPPKLPEVPEVPLARVMVAGASGGFIVVPHPLRAPVSLVESGQAGSATTGPSSGTKAQSFEAVEARVAAAAPRRSGQQLPQQEVQPEQQQLSQQEVQPELQPEQQLSQQDLQPEQQLSQQELQPEQQLSQQEVQPEQQQPAELSQQDLQPELPQQELQPQAAVVQFRFHCVTKPGERLWLVGDADALGCWDAAAGAAMKWGEGHIWSVSLPFEQGTTVAYKAVLQLGNSPPKHWRWQAGANCVLEARSSSSSSDGQPLKVQHDFK
ncbi:hypothetical protein COO60DRAFT_257917 [Scenedesmus sp. NREL 46B-D3]|nr:hypothetical protein COO60DRAFT_257917 [Scenedesmus sp. NREL 46B-D3]